MSSPAAARIHRIARRSRYFQCALGVVTAGLLFEIALRPFVADSTTAAGAASVRTIRSYFEGTAASHFEPDGLGPLGNRLTGNPSLPGSPEGIIIGDSHVAAFAVPDRDTMGAVVENLFRASGHPLNVRQYGWPASNVPEFIAAAAPILRARNPAWAAVVLNSYNMAVDSVMTPGGEISELPPASNSSRQPVFPQLLIRAGRSSALALALRRRAGQIQNRLRARDLSAKPSQESAHRDSISALKRAYGKRLIVVYAPAELTSVDPVETDLASICADQQVDFISVREPLLRDRNQNARLSRGFHNTAPGVGHFNAIGHKIIGQEIWRFLAARPPSLLPR